MPRSALENEEAKRAQSEALRGAGRGAFTWGVSFALMGGLAYAMSPIYRKLTIQFKVYLQMSGMIMGGMLEADRSMRQYEQHVRVQRMIARERAMRSALLEEEEDDE